MDKVLIALIIIGIVLMVFAFGRGFLDQDTYYRGVYEGCVHQSIVANRTTSYDLLACTQLEQRARRERWYDHRVVVSQ